MSEYDIEYDCSRCITVADLERQLAEAREDISFLLSFVPAWAKDVPTGLVCTFYGTLSEEGDRRVKAMVDKIVEKTKGGGR